jgi:hypothetical protein
LGRADYYSKLEEDCHRSIAQAAGSVRKWSLKLLQDPGHGSSMLRDGEFHRCW